MGVIRPPWVDVSWFNQCPFNYCDHFGDKRLLSRICKICREELEMFDRYEQEGKDPYDWNNVAEEMATSMAEAMVLMQKMAEEMGINLDEIPDNEYIRPNFQESEIYRLSLEFGESVGEMIKVLEAAAILKIGSHSQPLMIKAIDALGHSQYYVSAKTYRALCSRHDEENDPIEIDLADSKTSAFFAYVAITRNCEAMIALMKQKSLAEFENIFFKFSKMSLNLAELLRKEFFPAEKLVFEEFGGESY